MNSVGASILAIVALVILFGSRRAALLAMLAGVLYVPQAQQLEVMGFNMFSVRFLELAGFVRVVSRRELSFSKLNRIDHTLLLLYAFTAIMFCLRSSTDQAYVIGTAVDAWLCYFTFRAMVIDLEEFRWLLRMFVFLLVPYAALLLVESISRNNLFSTIENGLTGWERDGRLRCVGSFRHPDLLGTLGASFLALYIGLACTRTDRLRAAVGIATCLVIVWASNSGGPACAAATALAGWMCWKIRTHMRWVRWGIVATILSAALLMKAPVWYLLAHVSAITGGDGYHRSYLMDISFRHLDQWWLNGLPGSDTKDWFAYSLSFGSADMTNSYLAFGLTGGLGAMGLFIFLLVRCFKSLGTALETVRHYESESREAQFLLWGLGVMLAVHIINWFGVTYYDQFYAIWFLQLAAIANCSTQYLDRERTAVDLTVSSDADGLWPETVVPTETPINDERSPAASELSGWRT
ncbi:MAG TPA: hypothetical protein VMV72_12005 [Verrucomicrobiae bacterium]|nr:hypothetical protein [Verrucomicrobiae bacterium]